ncbi:cytochrome c nitrite reductase small subunit [Cytophagaceae bacterium ABcell3]|nr:cytochrome c nitrite reductase small subunit [Cytophagaceae bacterium ABcell3]
MGIKRFFDFFKPPRFWRIYVNSLLAVFVGVVALLFYISNAASYMSDAPETCINCHLMAPHYATWQHSSHREWTNCNDCHVPHDNIFSHYYFKAQDGLGHATVFTLRNEPQVIQIKEAGIRVVQENCIRCHSDLNEHVNLTEVTREKNLHGEGKLCWDCHREVPHGRVKGSSSTPDAQVPLLGSPVPEWLRKLRTRRQNPQNR